MNVYTKQDINEDTDLSGNKIRDETLIKMKLLTNRKKVSIYTEERPSENVILYIIHKIFNVKVKLKDIIIKAIFINNTFQFEYGIKINGCLLDDICIKIFQRTTSSVDYIVYYQTEEVIINKSLPILLIEETKTSWNNSGNQHWQRLAKFDMSEQYFPGVETVMIYNFPCIPKNNMTPGFKFSVRMIKTLKNVKVVILTTLEKHTIKYIEIIEKLKPFTDLNDFIHSFPRCKNKGECINLNIYKNNDDIILNAKLAKNQNGKLTLTHDPNKGFVIGCSMVIDSILNKQKYKIIIKNHGLPNAKMYFKKDKFGMAMIRYNIHLEGIETTFKQIDLDKTQYFKLSTGENNISILWDVMKTNKIIFSDHAGGETSYLEMNKCNNISSENECIQMEKKNNIPDLMLCYKKGNNLVVEICEAKINSEKNIKNGIQQLSKKHLEKIKDKIGRLRKIDYYKTNLLLYGDSKTIEIIKTYPGITDIDTVTILNKNGKLKLYDIANFNL